jgi:hypothetical protein
MNTQSFPAVVTQVFPVAVTEIISARGWDEDIFQTHLWEFLEARIENYEDEVMERFDEATAEDVANMDDAEISGGPATEAVKTVFAVLAMDADKLLGELLAMGRDKIEDFDAAFVEYLRSRADQESLPQP